MKILFFGDSITQAGMTKSKPLGDGYVSILAQMFKQDQRLAQTQLINCGIGGDTVLNLLQRYERDVLIHLPDYIIIKIGINDAYNDFQAGCLNSNFERYKQGYQNLVDCFRDALPRTRIILLTPYYISDDSNDPLYLRMNEYGEFVGKLALRNGLPLLSTQAVFDAAVKNTSARELAEDQVHPGYEGHMLLAQAIFPFLTRIILPKKA